MERTFKPGDTVLLYREPLPGRLWLWLRQFPTATVCICIFLCGMVFTKVAMNWGRTGKEMAGDPITSACPPPAPQPSGEPGKEVALSAMPLPDIFKPSHDADNPWVLTDFIPEDEEGRRTRAYVERFAKIALTEKERYGIPASIKLAQAIIETNAGTSKLATKANNHFGVKCFSRTCKKGHCINFGDDSHKDFFRKYGSAWESWRAHSRMIVSGKYKVLLKLPGDDYRGWAAGLKRLGYATAKEYDGTLIDLVEKYHLYDFDK